MNIFSTQVGVNDEMESSSEPENDSSDQLQATPILIMMIMMITMMTVEMKQWLRIFKDNDVYVDDNNNGEIAVKQ